MRKENLIPPKVCLIKSGIKNLAEDGVGMTEIENVRYRTLWNYVITLCKQWYTYPYANFCA